MSEFAPVALAVALTAPLVGGLTTLVPAARSGRTSVVGTSVALLAATGVLVAAALDRPATWVVDGRTLVQADRLGSLLLVFVLAAAAVVQAYARRSLRGDLLRHRFFAASSTAVAATALVVVAADLWALVAGWLVVSAATVLLLRHDARPTARDAARRALVWFAVGDLVLLGAAVAASGTVGTVTLRPDELATLTQGGDRVGPVTLVAVLAVGGVAAAMTRSAVPPAQSWLPMSVAAPTPSSAVLHAGIVNGGGLLLIRFAPVLAASRLATGAAVLGGCAGVLVGGAVARTRPDVKTGLAWSTVSQMGFMVVQCVTGLIGPALVHMVAHGMYKANLFLGSGSTLAHTHGPIPDPGRRTERVLWCIVATGSSVGLAWWIVRPTAFEGPAGWVFAAFVTATVAQASWSWLRVRERRSRLDLAAWAALAAATVAAVGVAAAIKDWVSPSLPEVDPALATAGAVALALTGLVAVGLAVLAHHGRGRGAELAERGYLWAAHLGDPGRLAGVMAPAEVRP